MVFWRNARQGVGDLGRGARATMKGAMRRALNVGGALAVAALLARVVVACGSFRDASVSDDASVANGTDADAAAQNGDASILTDAIATEDDASFAADSAGSPCVGTVHNFCDDFDGDGGLRLPSADGGDASDTWDFVSTSGAPSHGVTSDSYRSWPHSYRMDLKGDVLLQKTLQGGLRTSIAFDVLPATVSDTAAGGVLLKLERAGERVVTVTATVDTKGNYFCTIKDGKSAASDAVTLIGARWNHVNVTVDRSGSTLSVSPEGAPTMSKTVNSTVDVSPGPQLSLGFAGTGSWLYFFDNVVVDIGG